MPRHLPALLLGIGLAFSGEALFAASAKESQPRPGFDRFGDPLPPGAVARLGTVRLRQSGIIHAVSFSPDGKLLAAASRTSAPEQEQTLLLLDRLTGQARTRFRGHLGNINGVAFAPDGRTLASVSADGTCLIWDTSGQLQLGLAHGTVSSRKKPEEYWDDLAGLDAVKAFRAVRALTANAMQTLPLLRRRLHPIPPTDARQIARWIDNLDSDEFRVRRQAHMELEKLAEVAEPALREALGKTSSAEVRRQVRQLLQRLDCAPFSPKALQALRGIEILERIGTKEGRDLLDSLANGAAQARLTREARAALRRLR